jgi:hypothetical protein
MLSESSIGPPPPSPLRHRHQTFSESVLPSGNTGTTAAAAAAAADDDRMSTISDAMMSSNRQSMLLSPRYRVFPQFCHQRLN